MGACAESEQMSKDLTISQQAAGCQQTFMRIFFKFVTRECSNRESTIGI